MTSAPVIPVPIDLGEPFHIGSVQHLYDFPERPEWMVAETSDGGSVFDVGTIFSIPQAGACRALFRHQFYRHLGTPSEWESDLLAGFTEETQAFLQPVLAKMSDDGLATHHVGMLDGADGSVATEAAPAEPTRCNVVKRFPVLTPDRTTIAGRHLWDYSSMVAPEGRQVVPLEVIVRFGFTPQSSLFRKYDALEGENARKYAESIGVSSGTLVPWEFLETPVVDFTSKYEDTDRILNWQEALLISGLSGDLFRELVARALIAGQLLKNYLGAMGLQLWDLKWEFARDGEDLVLVDTIDTDSVRATLRTEDPSAMVHANKQSVRDHYELCHPEWLAGINQAKADAKTEGKVFGELLSQRQESGEAPANPELDPAFLALHTRRMEAINQLHMGEIDQAETATLLQQTAEDEVAYYKDLGLLSDYLSINGL